MSRTARAVAALLTTLTVSLGVAAVSTPAHGLDTSWGTGSAVRR